MLKKNTLYNLIGIFSTILVISVSLGYIVHEEKTTMPSIPPIRVATALNQTIQLTTSTQAVFLKGNNKYEQLTAVYFDTNGTHKSGSITMYLVNARNNSNALWAFYNYMKPIGVPFPNPVKSPNGTYIYSFQVWTNAYITDLRVCFSHYYLEFIVQGYHFVSEQALLNFADTEMNLVNNNVN